jgi:hypothetical protein
MYRVRRVNATSEACQKGNVLIMLSVQQNEINTKKYSMHKYL